MGKTFAGFAMGALAGALVAVVACFGVLEDLLRERYSH